MAILSGRFAEHMIRPTKPVPPLAFSMVGPVLAAASPVCTPMKPLRALNGCAVLLPEMKPARRRWSHHRRDSSVAVALL
jgi:hypothetical protein